MRTIGIITVGRSDYGIYRPVLRAIQNDPSLKLHLIVGGMHLLEKFGLTKREIENDGFKISQTAEFSLDNDNPEGIAQSMGAAIQAFSECYSRLRPDILLVLGDRFEMHAAALAALPFKIPVAHIHGGELTLGAIDNALRHSITVLSHLHFTATEEYKKRVLQLGEEPWRVHCTGAPALDDLINFQPKSLRELAQKFDLPLEEPPVLVTYHPVTLEYENTEWQIDQLLHALSVIDLPIVFTGTNADTKNSVIWSKIKAFIASRPKTHLVLNFGPDYYFSMLSHCRLMVGSSSSGLIEAPSFALPVVNIGTRQDGRVRGKNVIDVDYKKEEISRGIKQALSEEFHRSLKGVKNPYEKGKAAKQIAAILKNSAIEHLIPKSFINL